MSSLDSWAQEILDDGVIDADEVSQIRERLFEDGVIDREEAEFLFLLNDGATDADESWGVLFVEALIAHLLEDDESPGAVDEDEATWLIEHIEGDGVVDEIELALLVALTANAAECHESINAFTLAALKAAVIEDGIIDDDEAVMIQAVIYGQGGGSGADVDRAEADFLFDLNDATSGNDNCAAWERLFVEGIVQHLLCDDDSAGTIGAAETVWLVERIEGDGQVDELERSLLVRLGDEGVTLPERLAALL
ncbi:MAG TPA: hypothetical protein QGF58_06130 [Myxococcota bacterium]|nr:hypothetical protein [Myxococcota bacterium]